jgi:hypothetical protein
MPERNPILARPFARQRLTVYLFGLIVLTLFTLIPTIGIEVGLIKPNFAVDVIGNIVLAVPSWLVPLIVLWDAPDENRTPLQRGAELILVWLPFTAFSQVVYELTFLVGNVLGTWKPTRDPGWQWLWWQFSLADTRWWGDNPYMFALELVAVPVGTALLFIWFRLLRTTTSDERRIRSLWLAFAGMAMLFATTAVYFISECRTGFADIGQGWYGLGFKFIFINLPFLVVPPFVLFAIYRQVDYLTRRVGLRENGSTSSRRPAGRPMKCVARDGS